MTNRAQLGMAMFLIAEAVFFLLLILACKYFAPIPYLGSRNGWILTILLLASSLSMWRRWRWITIVLGAAFLIAQTILLSSMLTEIHGLHVLAGLIALAVVPTSAFKVMALYWYFFAALWIVMLVVAYAL
jgi:heme/copper-type cytochrome/quinol oxidase subunit 3